MSFYGWIPTNKGHLEFEFISIPHFYKDFLKEKRVTFTEKEITLNLEFMDDAFVFRKVSKKREQILSMEATVLINNSLNGNIKISWIDSIIYSKFKIYPNGIIEFLDFSVESNINIDITTIRQAMFVIVKSFVHGDVHHHQKIDTALQIEDNMFNPTNISESLLNHIKRLERNVKLNNSCESTLKNENTLEEAKGYLSYFESFILLFPSEVTKKNLKFSKNIIISLESLLQKRQNKKSYIDGFRTAIITFFGLFMTLSIFLNGFWFPNSNEITIYLHQFSRFNILIYTFFSILFSFFFYIRCSLKSYLFYEYYDTFELLNYIKNADKKDLNSLGKLIKALPFITFTIAFYSLALHLFL